MATENAEDLDVPEAWRGHMSCPRCAILAGRLGVLMVRLGTPDERAEDMDEAQRVGHELRNRLTIASGCPGVQRGGCGAAPGPGLCAREQELCAASRVNRNLSASMS